jgi:hypothetical protein
MGSALVTAQVGMAASFIIIAYDLYGNRKLDGRDVFGWSLTPASHSCVVDDCDLTQTACSDCDDCSSLFPIGTFVSCVSDARFNLGGVGTHMSQPNASGAYQVQYVGGAAGMYTLHVWLAREQDNASISGSPWKYISITNRYEGLVEASSSWDTASDSDSGSWSSEDDENRTEFNGSRVNGSAYRTESIYNGTDDSDSDSGSWFDVYGTNHSDFAANSSVGMDQELQTPEDYNNCADEADRKIHFSATGYLEDSLFDVNILLNHTLSPVEPSAVEIDCRRFISSASTNSTVSALLPIVHSSCVQVLSARRKNSAMTYVAQLLAIDLYSVALIGIV